MRKILLLIYGIPIFLLLFLPNVDAQTGIYPAPILLGPTNGQKLGRETVTFQWAWEGELAEDEYFCVEVWESQMEPISAPLRLTRSTSLSVPAIDLLPGDYQWRVTVLRVADRLPEEELSESSETWSFSWGQAISGLGQITLKPIDPAQIKEGLANLLAGVFIITIVVGPILVVGIIVRLVVERNHISWTMALGLLPRPKELVSATRSNYIERKWPSWERSIEQAISKYLREGRELLRERSLSKIPKPFRRYALNRYYDDYGREQGFVRVDQGYRLRVVGTSEGIPDLMDSLIKSLDEPNGWKRETSFSNSSKFLLEELTRLMKSIEMQDEEYTHEYMYGYLVRLPILRLNVPRYLPIVFLQKTTFAERDVAKLVDFIKNYDEHFLALLITFDTKGHTGKSSAQLSHFISKSPYAAEDFIILDVNDILDILKAKDKSASFIQLIVKRRNLRALSPYVTAGPVPENMFFGRDREVKAIVEGVMASNFAIVGGRKIGKTSILQQVYLSLQNNLQYFILYIDCQAVKTYEDFFSALGEDKGTLDSDPAHFRNIMSILQRETGDKRVVILIDEVDDILNYDIGNGERLFKTFRSLSQERYCNFVFCGGKTLYQRIHHSRSPFFNFCREIRLGELDTGSSREIIVRPMDDMNVELEDGVVSDILRISSCHPNLVQYMCDRLIHQISSRHVRRISLEDLRIVTTRRDFYEYFIKTIWGDATPLEKMITLCTLNGYYFTKQQIYAILKKYSLQDRQAIEEALETLELYCFFTRGRKMYHYTWREFPRVVREVVNVEDKVKDLLRQVKQ